MKNYLIELCEEIDEVMTHSCDCYNWKEEILSVIHKHLYLFQNHTGKDLEDFLSDIEECENINI